MKKWIEEILYPVICSGSKTDTILSGEQRERLVSYIEHLEARCAKMEEGIKRLHDHPALQVKCDLSPEHLIVDSDVFHELEGILEK